MKIIGQHGELGFDNKASGIERQIQIMKGERIEVIVKSILTNPVTEEDILHYFMSGTLILIWKPEREPKRKRRE